MSTTAKITVSNLDHQHWFENAFTVLDALQGMFPDSAIEISVEKVDEPEAIPVRKRVEHYRDKLMLLLEQEGSLNSMQAQKLLGLKGVKWGGRVVRTILQEAVNEGLVAVEGVKKGTIYKALPGSIV